MRKYIIGFFAGCVFMTMATAFAEEVQSIIGKKVENTYPVTVNGASLSTQAAVIDGSAYLPVRAVSDAVGLNVGFSETTGITLTEKEVKSVSDTSPVSTTTETNSTNEPVSANYKGLRAYIYNGETYYSPKDYNDLHPNAKVFSVKDGYTKVKKADKSEFTLNNSDTKVIIFVNGETYINIQYYPE